VRAGQDDVRLTSAAGGHGHWRARPAGLSPGTWHGRSPENEIQPTVDDVVSVVKIRCLGE